MHAMFLTCCDAQFFFWFLNHYTLLILRLFSTPCSGTENSVLVWVDYERICLLTVLVPKSHTTSVGGAARTNINKDGGNVFPRKKCEGNCSTMPFKSVLVPFFKWQQLKQNMCPAEVNDLTTDLRAYEK